MQKIHCDDCDHAFKPKIREKKHTAAVREQYFTCPKCRHHYTIGVADGDSRVIERKICALQKEKQAYALQFTSNAIDKPEYTRQVDRLDGEIKRNQAEWKNRSERLQAIYQ